MKQRYDKVVLQKIVRFLTNNGQEAILSQMTK